MHTFQLTPDVFLYHADAFDALRALPPDCLDSCVTDPPYHLTSVVKRFGGANAAPAQFGTDGAFARASRGFMGKEWDGGDIAFRPEFWAEVLRVLKPGAHLAAFGASRGYHRMACAIEDAGFEVRDSLMWLYGVGFPKSHNISKHEFFCQCETEPPPECGVRSLHRNDVSPSDRTATERGQVLQPSVSQRGSQDVRAEQSERFAGSAQSGVEGRCNIPSPPGQLRSGEICSLSAEISGDGAIGRLRDGAPLGHGATLPPPPDADGMRASLGSQAAAQRGNEPRIVAGQSQSQDGGAWSHCGRCGKPLVPDGLGTALKPAFEPIVLARKPLSEGTVAANVLRWRTGAINVDATRIPTDADDAPVSWNAPRGGICPPDSAARAELVQTGKGRWPANVVHDGSDEVVSGFPSTAPARAGKRNAPKTGGTFGNYTGDDAERLGHTDNGGSAARFFYSAKASKADRAGSKHPTVKPVALMQWLARLITPPGGVVLDPFSGSGTTGAAAAAEGFRAVLIEREVEYVADIRARFGLKQAA